SLLLTLAGLCATLPLAAQGRGSSSLVVTAQNVTAATSGRADKSVAQPGDEIRYRLVFTNVTAGPVRNIQFVDPIPAGMVYVLGSATADHAVRIEYSIDSGKSYAARPVIAALVNGQRVEKPAPRELYTHVRWTVLGSLAPRARVMAELRTQVSEAPGEAK